MVDYFTAYDWSGISLVNVLKLVVSSDDVGNVIHFSKPLCFYQISLKHTGKTNIVYNGKPISFTENSVLYLPKEKNDKINYTKTIVEEGGGVCIFFNTSSELPDFPFLIKCADNPKVAEYFFKLLNLYNKKKPNKNLDSMVVMYQLLSALSETIENNTDNLKLRGRLNSTLKYIEEHYTDEYIELKTLSDMSGMSSDYFRHAFYRVCGMSPIKYINTCRIEKAKQLLLEGNSISDVATMVGIRDSNYFTRLFRESTGVTPSAFIKGNYV